MPLRCRAGTALAEAPPGMSLEGAKPAPGVFQLLEADAFLRNRWSLSLLGTCTVFDASPNGVRPTSALQTLLGY